MKALGVFYFAHSYYKILVRIPLLSLYKIKHNYSFIEEIKKLCKKRTLVSLYKIKHNYSFIKEIKKCKKRTLVSLCITYWVTIEISNKF